MEHQMGYSIWMTRCVLNRDRAAYARAKNRELREIECLDQALEVLKPGIEGDVLEMSVGQAAAAQVVAHDRVLARKCLKQRPPHRTVPLVLEMGEPGAGHHQWWPLAAHGVGTFHAVSALAVTDPLFHVRTRGCGIRTILLRCGGSARGNSGG